MRIGDVFYAQIDSKYKKYFQYIAKDLNMLNSDVIRVFKKKYKEKETPELSEIMKDDIDFYAHCVVKWGVKMGLWKKEGNYQSEINFDNVLFRDTDDCGKTNSEEIVRISENWHVWKINDSEFTHVGKLKGDNKKAEVGVVVAPDSIVYRMLHGEYDFVYPSYE